MSKSGLPIGVKKCVAGLALLALTVTATACTIGGAAGGPGGQSDSVQANVEKHDTPVVSVADGATDVSPGEPVTVTAPGEGLAEVSMVNEDGREVESKTESDGTWTTAEPLGYNRTYTVTATAKDGTETTSEFQTSTPAAQTAVSLSPIPDSTVGIGQTIMFVFGSAPTDREAVEKAITITTSNDTVGDFNWVGPTDLRWRPKEFWEPGTEVTVEADLYGVNMGGGVYGAEDNATNFTIGDDVRAYVNDNTKTMEVYRNGELLRTIPVSLGRDTGQWATPNGTYVVGDESPQLMMNSETFGLPVSQGGYETMVDYATQLSYSGIYVHSAPWSVYAQGSSNTSHGCVNVSPEAAAWFQNTVKRGDPVIVENTIGGELAFWDGLGSWNASWEDWQADES